MENNITVSLCGYWLQEYCNLASVHVFIIYLLIPET